MSKKDKKGTPLNEDDFMSSFTGGGSLPMGGNVASTISQQFGDGLLNFDTKDFNTEHADDAVDFEDISLTDESMNGDNNDGNKGSNTNNVQDGLRSSSAPPVSSNDINNNNNIIDSATGIHNIMGIPNNSAPLSPSNLGLDFNFSNDVFDGFDSSSNDNVNSAFSGIFDNSMEIPSNIQPLMPNEMMNLGNNNTFIASKNTEEILKQQRLERQRLAKEKIEKESRLLHYYYPMFQKNGILKMHSIFRSRPPLNEQNLFFNTHSSLKNLPKKTFLPTKLQLQFQVDEKKLFNRKRKKNQLANKNDWYNDVIEISEDYFQQFYQNENIIDMKTEDEKDIILASAGWDDKIIMGDDDEEIDRPIKRPKLSNGISSEELHQFDDFEVNEEIEDNILEGKINDSKTIGLKLDMNDPKLYFTNDANFSMKKKGLNRSLIPSNDKLLFRRFNVSNDNEYDILKTNYQAKIRATVGNLIIDHSLPAIRLQHPYYKVKLTKQQLRSSHRPKFIVRANTTMHFSKPKLRKRKRDKGKDIKESFASTSDLTMADTAPFYLFEYSEEKPLVFSNFGMGSKIINYYRKKNEEDTYRPKGLIGETHVLGVRDRSPFWNFGFVEKGTFVPTLYNQMVRAPIFQHDGNSTDFLLIKSSGGSRSYVRYYLRSISKMFLVGQLYPVVEVPGPHSRKVTTVSKNRLKMIVFRVLNNSKQQRLAVKDISAHFPDQNDMQNRQRLKEFMVYQRTGEDQGFWKIKPNEKLPTEEEIRAMIPPEDLCLLESMQIGQQHLEDYSIYSYDSINLDKYQNLIKKLNAKNDLNNALNNVNSPLAIANTPKPNDKDEAGNNDNKGEPLEDQLAPWNTTRNFINATQGKAMLQLRGEGEPTDIGEGISFLRTSMKGGFKPTGMEEKNDKLGGHSYNVALQQKAYDEEIKRTWLKQIQTLSQDEPRGYPEKRRKRGSRYDTRPKGLVPKILRITRMIRNQYGVLERKVEIIKDERIINAYLHKRQKLYEDYLATQSKELSQNNIDLSTVKIPTNEDEKKILQQELEKLQAQKNNTKILQSGKGIGKGRNTKRKCALCGAIGHIRTKKSCPMYGKAPGSAVGTPGATTAEVSTPTNNRST